MKVEREHTKKYRNPAHARIREKNTACDHILENSRYYSRWLIPMERAMERDAKKRAKK